MGKAPQYLSNTLIKLVASTKLDPSKDYGIKGFLVKAQLIKSRSNAAGNEVTLVFDQENGFSDVLSSWQVLKELKVIAGSGHGYYLPNLPDVKVKQKDIVSTYNTNEKFRKALDECIREHCEEFLNITADPDLERVTGLDEEVLEDVPSDLEYEEEHELYYSESTDTWYDEIDGQYVIVESEEE